MRKLSTAVLIATLSCSRSTPTPNDPASVAKAFVTLARAGKCPEAYALYSQASKDSIAELSSRMLRGQTPQYLAQFGPKFAPDRLDCGIYAEYLPNTVRESTRDGDHAVVSVTSRTGSPIPIPFFSDPIKNTLVTMQLTFEDGRWRIVHPMAWPRP
jgi:hypothetical protein